MCRFCCSSISPGFAESSWQGNHEETSPSHITCNGQPHASHLPVSLFPPHSLSPMCGEILNYFLSFFFPLSPPSFVLILTFMRSTQPFCRFGLLPYIVSQTREEGMSRAAERAALSIQNPDQPPAEHEESYKLSSQRDTVNVKLTMRAKGSVELDKCYMY